MYTRGVQFYNKLATLGLKFICLIMEDAAQISEFDSFVPLLSTFSKKSDLIEDDDNTFSGLKYLVLMGYMKKLPLVVKSPALKNYAHFDQSLFADCCGLVSLTLFLTTKVAVGVNWLTFSGGDMTITSRMRKRMR
ncbi:hypothetical protein PsorP6_001092 [Peronosclerospora sorghi]|uniref:Uncharacterized protein n=1 Tax=Peronosclerospora sorghi TaxID=230839 RepID=A0ACC0WX91_9STRA|nr:hypothetical protein PsorP6_001092 [Peronosclerospora sorghi]